MQDATKLKVKIGGDNRLAVTLSPYAPTVQCEGSSIPFNRGSCAAIERGMQAYDKQLLFGDSRLDPAVDEELPYELLSGQVPLSYAAAAIDSRGLC